ncbi:unnamed protein product, partial [Urochloa humidicola]
QDSDRLTRIRDDNFVASCQPEGLLDKYLKAFIQFIMMPRGMSLLVGCNSR